MRTLIILATLALSGPAFAAGLTTNTVLGTSIQQVQSKLTTMGYDVRKSEMEHGKIEVYVVKDGTMAEVYVSTKTGKVTRLKTK